MTANDPSKGVRVVETNPYDSDASEFTWHGTGTTTYDTTRGNSTYLFRLHMFEDPARLSYMQREHKLIDIQMQSRKPTGKVILLT